MTSPSYASEEIYLDIEKSWPHLTSSLHEIDSVKAAAALYMVAALDPDEDIQRFSYASFGPEPSFLSTLADDKEGLASAGFDLALSTYFNLENDGARVFRNLTRSFYYKSIWKKESVSCALDIALELDTKKYTPPLEQPPFEEWPSFEAQAIDNVLLRANLILKAEEDVLGSCSFVAMKDKSLDLATRWVEKADLRQKNSVNYSVLNVLNNFASEEALEALKKRIGGMVRHSCLHWSRINEDHFRGEYPRIVDLLEL